MDGEPIKSKMKASPAFFPPKLGQCIVAVFVICSAFLICTYLLVNHRIAAVEKQLARLQRNGEKPNPNVSSDGKSGAHQVLNNREKRSAKQQSQLNVAELEKRLKDLENRLLWLFHLLICDVFSKIWVCPLTVIYQYNFFPLRPKQAIYFCQFNDVRGWRDSSSNIAAL